MEGSWNRTWVCIEESPSQGRSHIKKRQNTFGHAGFPQSWRNLEVMEFWKSFFQAWKVMDFSHFGQSHWKKWIKWLASLKSCYMGRLSRTSQVNLPWPSQFGISQEPVQATQTWLSYWCQCKNWGTKCLRHETKFDLIRNHSFIFYYDSLFINQLIV